MMSFASSRLSVSPCGSLLSSSLPNVLNAVMGFFTWLCSSRGETMDLVTYPTRNGTAHCASLADEAITNTLYNAQSPWLVAHRRCKQRCERKEHRTPGFEAKGQPRRLKDAPLPASALR